MQTNGDEYTRLFENCEHFFSYGTLVPYYTSGQHRCYSVLHQLSQVHLPMGHQGPCWLKSLAWRVQALWTSSLKPSTYSSVSHIELRPDHGSKHLLPLWIIRSMSFAELLPSQAQRTEISRVLTGRARVKHAPVWSIMAKVGINLHVNMVQNFQIDIICDAVLVCKIVMIINLKCKLRYSNDRGSSDSHYVDDITFWPQCEYWGVDTHMCLPVHGQCLDSNHYAWTYRRTADAAMVHQCDIDIGQLVFESMNLMSCTVISDKARWWINTLTKKVDNLNRTCIWFIRIVDGWLQIIMKVG